MANPNSIFSSSSSQKQWVSQMRKTLSKEHVTIIDKIPPCVLHVPKAVSDEKPEAYAPQHIGLGPYHHFRPDLYNMHKHKLAASIRVVVNPNQFSHVENLIIDKFILLEPIIRLCYDKYLDLDGDTLAWVLVIDGFFLLDLLATHSKNSGTGCTTNDDNNINRLEGREVIGDVMMLENQLPLFVLEDILKGVNENKKSTDNDWLVDYTSDLYDMLRDYCETYSPLNLNEEYRFRYSTRVHLVDYMYHLIINNRGIRDSPTTFKPSTKILQEPCDTVIVDNVIGIASIVISAGVGGEETKKAFTFIKQLPWEKILSFFKKQESSDDNKSSVIEEIEIPPASSLCKIAQVVFCVTTGGIRDIKYDEEKRILYLPVITLKKHSEVILRNLVAYEALIAKPGSCLELGEYVDMMCGIIDTVEDVIILREKEIIKGGLDNEEIVKVFNGISKSRGKAKIKSDLGKAIEKVNKHFDNTWKIKMNKFVKKRVYDSWKCLTVSSTIVLLMLLILQTFCDVYGCSRFFKRT